MPLTPTSIPGRTRKAHNVYLDKGLAESAKRIAQNSNHKSLSGLIESLLRKEIANSK